MILRARAKLQRRLVDPVKKFHIEMESNQFSFRVFWRGSAVNFALGCAWALTLRFALCAMPCALVSQRLSACVCGYFRLSPCTMRYASLALRPSP
jgi:hypothetical protein